MLAHAKQPLLLSLLAALTLTACTDPPAQPSDNHNTPNNTRVDACTSPAYQCLSKSTYKSCVQNQWVEKTCDANTICDFNAQSEDASAVTSPCKPQICIPNQVDGCSPEGGQAVCNADGTRLEHKACPVKSQICYNGSCEEPSCPPGEKRCLDTSTLQVCSPAGVWQTGTACPQGQECFGGKCEDLCDFDNKVSSYVGCEYWSVDLPNYENAVTQPHAVVVANINPTLTATLHFYEGATSTEITSGPQGPFKLTLAPGEIAAYPFPTNYGHAGTALLKNKAIRLESNIPVIAYQYNPLHNAIKVYSNDGTLLLPTNAVGNEYYVLGWTHRQDIPTRGFVTVVNSSGFQNEVTITPSAEIVAGPDLGPYPAGTTFKVTLEPGESLNLETSGLEAAQAAALGCLKDTPSAASVTSPCPDLTGTYIKGAESLTVFAGHQCANIPMHVDRCDHIESILAPVSSWGDRFVAAKFHPRAPMSTPEPDFYRVIAAEDQTLIQTSPKVAGIHGKRLNKGEWAEFATSENFVLKGSKPVMVSQYMVGSNWTGIPRNCKQGADAQNPTGIGDPAMTLLVPKKQWRKEYNVLTPRSYEEDYLTIVAPKGTSILFDGNLIDMSSATPIGAAGANVAITLDVKPGQHTLKGNLPFGVLSYGYACHVSYATPGGMNVETIYNHL